MSAASPTRSTKLTAGGHPSYNPFRRPSMTGGRHPPQDTPLHHKHGGKRHVNPKVT